MFLEGDVRWRWLNGRWQSYSKVPLIRSQGDLGGERSLALLGSPCDGERFVIQCRTGGVCLSLC